MVKAIFWCSVNSARANVSYLKCLRYRSHAHHAVTVLITRLRVRRCLGEPIPMQQACDCFVTKGNAGPTEAGSLAPSHNAK